MDQRVVQAYAQIVAAQARIEGMKAENAACEIRGETPAYLEGSFNSEADGLEFLAQHLHNL